MNSDLTEPLLLNAEEDPDPVSSSNTEEHKNNDNDNNVTGVHEGETEEDQGDDQNHETIMPHSKAFFLTAVSVATIPMFLFGFNTGVLNAPEAVIFPNHTTLEWSSAVSGFCVGGFVGANFSGSLADQWGRSVGLVTIFWINLAAGILHMMTPNMGGLILARILVGVGRRSIYRDYTDVSIGNQSQGYSRKYWNLDTVVMCSWYSGFHSMGIAL